MQSSYRLWRPQEGILLPYNGRKFQQIRWYAKGCETCQSSQKGRRGTSVRELKVRKRQHQCHTKPTTWGQEGKRKTWERNRVAQQHEKIQCRRPRQRKQRRWRVGLCHQDGQSWGARWIWHQQDHRAQWQSCMLPARVVSSKMQCIQ